MPVVVLAAWPLNQTTCACCARTQDQPDVIRLLWRRFLQYRKAERAHRRLSKPRVRQAVRHRHRPKAVHSCRSTNQQDRSGLGHVRAYLQAGSARRQPSTWCSSNYRWAQATPACLGSRALVQQLSSAGMHLEFQTDDIVTPSGSLGQGWQRASLPSRFEASVSPFL